MDHTAALEFDTGKASAQPFLAAGRSLPRFKQMASLPLTSSEKNIASFHVQ